MEPQAPESLLHPPPSSAPPTRLLELTLLFLKLGATAFGGPAAHVALMRDEFVARRKWITNQQFLDLLGATNLIPGPNSTEIAIHLGYLRAGLPGLAIAGIAFILPAMLMVIGLAWAYMQYGETPQVGWVLYGIKPVIIAIIAQALWSLGKQAVKGPLTALTGVTSLLLYLVGANEIAVLFAAGFVVLLIRNVGNAEWQGWRGLRSVAWVLPAADARKLAGAGGFAGAVGLAAQIPFSLTVMFFTFLKIGAVLYGSGYVLLAFLRSDFVERLGWITEEQLIEAIAIGQVTPGPVSTTATFIGYLLAGVPGAVIATAGIFLPAFLFVALTNPLIPKLRSSPLASALLDGVNAASLGLMAGVTIQLAQAALIDLSTIIAALLSALLLLRFKINATWLIAGGALLGLIRWLAG